MKQNNPANEKQ